jgi:hypothetical protein
VRTLCIGRDRHMALRLILQPLNSAQPDGTTHNEQQAPIICIISLWQTAGAQRLTALWARYTFILTHTLQKRKKKQQSRA